MSDDVMTEHDMIIGHRLNDLVKDLKKQGLKVRIQGDWFCECPSCLTASEGADEEDC